MRAERGIRGLDPAIDHRGVSRLLRRLNREWTQIQGASERLGPLSGLSRLGEPLDPASKSIDCPTSFAFIRVHSRLNRMHTTKAAEGGSAAGRWWQGRSRIESRR